MSKPITAAYSLPEAPDDWTFAELGVKATRVDDGSLLLRAPKDVLDVLQRLFQERREVSTR